MADSQQKRASYAVPVHRIELVQTHSVLSRFRRHTKQPSQVAHLFREVVGNADREHLLAFFLDSTPRAADAGA